MLTQQQSVNEAFTRQSQHFDDEDAGNPILLRMRRQVYQHVDKYIKPNSAILELNAGTGIDAMRFIGRGHNVHATDVAEGMIAQIEKKMFRNNLAGRLSYQQLSYTDLDKVNRKNFDYIFSNFGGLNCVDDLTKVTRHFSSLLNAGSFVTLVIMPNVCPWEIAGVFRHGKRALRRFRPQGVLSHLEGKYFQTYYHSLGKIRSAFDTRFSFIESEGLAALTPPPHRSDFQGRFPTLNKMLARIDDGARSWFPLNRWADHIIVTFQYTP